MGIFDGILGAITAPVASIASSLIGGGFSAYGANEANQTNLEISQQNNAFNAQQAELNRSFQQASADKQMAFQKEQSGSVFQRAVSDMSAAGLNPMLAVSQGGNPSMGGSSAGGSSASAASVPQMLNRFGAFNNTGDALRNASEIARVQAETKLRDQEYEINKPRVKAAGLVEKGADTVTSGVGKAAATVSEAVMAVEDSLPGIVSDAKAVANGIVEKAKEAGVSLSEVVANPTKTIQRFTHSASQAASRAAKAVQSDKLNEVVNGPLGVKPNASRGKLSPGIRNWDFGLRRQGGSNQEPWSW